MRNCLLLVEDDAVLRGGLAELFEREGYEVIQASTISDARACLSARIDIVVLDVMLPDGDGVDLCKQWRGAGMRAPILFLTAKDEEFDIVRGLDSGGNDYVTKPFRMQELLSRARALLRRDVQPASAYGDIFIDKSRMQVSRGGEVVPLTLTEYKLLIKLAGSKGVLTRAALLGALWDDGANFVDDNTLSVHISRLRDKIGSAHIRTVRGVGYRWQY